MQTETQIHLGNKLSKKHILYKKNKMNVKLAVQTLRKANLFHIIFKLRQHNFNWCVFWILWSCFMASFYTGINYALMLVWVRLKQFLFAAMSLNFRLSWEQRLQSSTWRTWTPSLMFSTQGEIIILLFKPEISWQHFCDTQSSFFCFNQKNLFTKPSWNNF